MGEKIFRVVILITQLIMLLIIFTRIRKKAGYFYKGISAGIIAYYTVFPLVINLFYLFGGYSLQEEILAKSLLNYIVNVDLFKMVTTGIMAIVFELLFSYSYSSRIKFTIANLNHNTRIERENKQNVVHTLIIVGNIALIVGGVCTLYYMLSFGSISRAIKLSGYVRSFTVNSTQYVSYIASILIIPAGAVVISPFCFLLALDYNGDIWKRIKFIVSIILSALFFMVKAGRAPLLIFIVSFFMPILIKKTKHPWLILCFIALVGLPIVDFLDVLFDNTLLAVGYNFTNYIAQFSYPYRTVTNIFDLVEKYGIRWGQDFITSFLGMIPGLNFDSTWRIVSEYTAGAGWQAKGSTPTDLISFCVMEFHVFGILLSTILGLICRKLDEGLNSLETSTIDSEVGINALCSFCLLNCFWFVSTADFESLVRNIFFLATCVLILFVTKGKKKEHSLY